MPVKENLWGLGTNIRINYPAYRKFKMIGARKLGFRKDSQANTERIAGTTQYEQLYHTLKVSDRLDERGRTDAEKMYYELQLMGGWLELELPKSIFALGPIKEYAKAAEKTQNDYKGDHLQNKDLVRSTLAVPDKSYAKLFQLCTIRLKAAGLGIERVKFKDKMDTKNDYGYTDLNCVLKLAEFRLGFEIQLNTLSMLYAKHPMKEFLQIFFPKKTEADETGLNEYKKLEAEFPDVPGGLGHLWYDIGTVGGPLNKVIAQDASKAYMGYFRRETTGNVANEVMRACLEASTSATSLKTAEITKKMKVCVREGSQRAIDFVRPYTDAYAARSIREFRDSNAVEEKPSSPRVPRLRRLFGNR